MDRISSAVPTLVDTTYRVLSSSLPQLAYPLEPSFRLHRHDAEPAGLHLTSRQDNYKLALWRAEHICQVDDCRNPRSRQLEIEMTIRKWEDQWILPMIYPTKKCDTRKLLRQGLCYAGPVWRAWLKIGLAEARLVVMIASITNSEPSAWRDSLHLKAPGFQSQNTLYPLSDISTHNLLWQRLFKS